MLAVSSKTAARPPAGGQSYCLLGGQEGCASRAVAGKIILINVGLAIKNVSKCKVQRRFRF